MVQLSDIHIGQEKSRLLFHQDIRNELLHDLRQLRDQQGDANSIAIIGDTAFAGRDNEYEEARLWFNKVRETAGSSEDIIYLIPGNHDINRNNITPAVDLLHKSIRGVVSEGELIQRLSAFYEDEVAADIMLAKLQDYRKFARNYGRDFDSFGKAFWTDDLPGFDAPLLRIVGLNTVLVSDKSDNRGEMVLDASQYLLPRIENVEYIVCMHHPIEWLRNNHTVRAYLESRARIILVGHEHILRVNHVRNMNGFERLEIYSGATNPQSDESGYEFRYNWLEISVRNTGSLRELFVSLWPRVWTKTSGFVPDRNLLRGPESKTYILPLSVE